MIRKDVYSKMSILQQTNQLLRKKQKKIKIKKDWILFIQFCKIFDVKKVSIV